MLTCFTIGSVVGIVSPAIASADSAKATTSTVNLRESLIDRLGSTDTEKQSEDRMGLSQYGLPSNDIDSKMSVVQGADGLTYVVANDGKSKKGSNSGSIEVAVDKKRQADANQANLDVNSFYDVDYNNVKSLQSALNNKNFPFLSTDAELKANPKNAYDGIINHKKTKSYFAERILALSKNLNDIPSTYTSISGDERRAVISKAYTTEPDVEQTTTKAKSNGLFGTIASLFETKASAANVNQYRINPPSGYPWVMYIVRANGTDYTENVGVYRIINGQNAFCIEPGLAATTSYTGSQNGLTQAQKIRISSYLTAYNEFGGWVQNQDGFNRWIATQILVWTAVSQPPKSVTVTPNWASAVNNWRNQIQARADVIKIAPTWNTQNQTVKKGDTAKFTVTNANNWGGYNLYVQSVSGGGTASYANGAISVNTSNATSNVIKVNIYKGVSPGAYSAPTVWANGSYQKLITGNLAQMATLTVNVTNPQGQVSITKTDKLSKEPLAGATFKFSYNNTSKEVTTDAKGIALLPDKLNDGTAVSVVETKAPTGYTLYKGSVSLKVVGGQTVTANVADARDNGTLALNKTGDLGHTALPNIAFDIYNSDGTIYKNNVITDNSGNFSLKGMPIGDYYAVETKGSGGYYSSDKKYTFTITSDNWDKDPAKLNIENSYDLKLNKTVSDMNESNVTTNNWSIHKDDFLKYDLSANLQKAGTNNLTEFTLVDNIDSTHVDVTNARVFAQNNTSGDVKDVTSMFNIDTTKAGVVKAQAKASNLTNDSFYNTTYTLETKMKIKASFVAQGGNRETLNIVEPGNATVTYGSQKTLTSNNVTTILQAKTITVNHVKDVDHNFVFKTDTMKKYVGENYSIPPYDQFMDGTLKYLPTILEPQTGIVKDDMKLTFEYFNPQLDINADKITIDTAKAGTQLPVHIDFSKDGDADLLGNAEWKVLVHDKTNNKDVFNKTFTVSNGVSNDDINLDASYLKKNTKTEYEFTIVITKKDGGTVNTKTVNLNTFGYTSSEKVITNADADSNNHYDYSAVARTVKTRKDNKYVELSERIAFDFNNEFKSKTGYGFEVNLSPTYTSEIGDKPNLTLNALISDKLIDSYLNSGTNGYKSSNGVTTVPYVNTNTLSNDVSESMKFQFPTTYVEAKTGALFNDAQKQNVDPKIKSVSSLSDGGHKFYLPIWMKVGVYDDAYELKSNVIGKNDIQIDVKSDINAYAQMISTLDSSTQKEDELLVQPVLPSMGSDDKKIFGLSVDDWIWIQNSNPDSSVTVSQ